MRYSSAIALAAAIPAFVSAQTVHNVTVGANAGLVFDPPSTTAAVGDSITFTFQSKNHSVVQSTFADPCTRSNINGTQGFGSGFQAVEANAAQLPSFTINVTSDAAIWFYCGQKIPLDHCANGMVGVVNPPADKTLDAFKAKAMTTGNATSTTGGASPSGTASATPSNGAIHMSGSATAGLVTLLGLMAGLAL